MRVRQLLSIELSNICIIKKNNKHFSEDLKWISALVSSKRIVYNLENLVHVIAKPLVALGSPLRLTSWKQIAHVQSLVTPLN